MAKQYIDEKIDYIENSDFFLYFVTEEGTSDFTFDDMIEHIGNIKKDIIQRHNLYDFEVFLRPEMYSDGEIDFKVMRRRLETDEEYETRLKKEQKDADKKEKAKQKKIENLLKTMSKEEILERLS